MERTRGAAWRAGNPADGSLQETAIRETREETGLDLIQGGEILGALDDLAPRSMPGAILVRPFVAFLREDAALELSDEVAAAFWVPLDALIAPARSASRPSTSAALSGA